MELGEFILSFLKDIVIFSLLVYVFTHPVNAIGGVVICLGYVASRLQYYKEKLMEDQNHF